MADCPDERKWPALLAALDDPSPLVRSAAATELRGNLAMPEIRDALSRATGDSYRLVRIRAAMALAAYPPDSIPEAKRSQVEAGWRELEAALLSRPDDWSLNNALGNFWLDRSQLNKARLSFQRATRLRPDMPMPWVNLSIVCARLGNNPAAKQSLAQALQLDPNSPVAKFNLALLEAEQGQTYEAEKLLRDVLKTDPEMSQAAYNLGILLAAKRDMLEAVQWCRRAATLRPDEPRYGYTLGFYLREGGKVKEASHVLQELIKRHPEFVDAYLLLGEIYSSQRQNNQAREVYAAAARLSHLEPSQKRFLEDKLRD